MFFTITNTVESLLEELSRESVAACFPIDEAKRIVEVAKLGNINVTKPQACTLTMIYGYMKFTPLDEKKPLVLFVLEGPLGKALVLVDDMLVSTYGDALSQCKLVYEDIISGEQTLECLAQLQQKQHRITSAADILLVERLLGRSDFIFTNVTSLD